MRRRIAYAASAVIGLASSAPAAAAASTPAAPLITVALNETVDTWAVPAGIDPGASILSKLQLSGTLFGDRLGLPGWKAHAQIFRFDGQALTARQGDIQTADNLEAVPVTRLFEAWLARQWGDDTRSTSLRAGLIDLNSQFDSIDPAGLFINSSHGIGPDLSRSGISGPSIYPVSALGATVSLLRSPRWTFRLGLFGGVPGDPDRSRAFVAERLARKDGLLAIAQADWSPTQDSRIETGAWRYTAVAPGPDGTPAHDSGAYASFQAPLQIPPRTTGWVRAGLANGRAQSVASYIGFGAVQQGSFPGRPEDSLGLAIAHAIVGAPAVAMTGVHRTETAIEATYQAQISDRLTIQPDIQYIRHPAGIAGAPDSLGVGLRLVVSARFPKKSQAVTSSTATQPGG